MPRIRTVKPEFFTHPEILQLSIPARLLFLSLLTQADDAGRLYDQPARIVANAFGEADRVKPRGLVDELAARGRILRYEADGRACIQIVNFRRHQRVDKPSPSTIPPPPFDEHSPNAPGTVPESLPEGSRLERKGKEQGTGKGAKTLAPDEPARRPRDEVWEAFCDVTGVDWHDLSAARRTQLNGMLKSIRQRGADTPEEIRRRAENWPWDVVITPEGFVRRWAELSKPRAVAGTPNGVMSDQARRGMALADELERRGM